MKLKINKILTVTWGKCSALVLFDDVYESIIRRFADRNKPIKTITFDDSRPRSTGPLSQNAKYYAIVEDIAAFMEIPKSMAHSGLKQLGYDDGILEGVTNPITGTIEGESESGWDTEKASKMIEVGLRFMAENGIGGGENGV